MTLEQVVLTMINDKMLDNGQISEKLHSSIQKDIITLSTFNTACLLYTSCISGFVFGLKIRMAKCR